MVPPPPRMKHAKRVGRHATTLNDIPSGFSSGTGLGTARTFPKQKRLIVELGLASYSQKPA